MASLLDMVVAQRNPRLAGLLGSQGDQPIPNQQPVPVQQSPVSLMGGGAQAAPSPGGGGQQAQGPSGLEGVLGELFGGFDNPNLPPEANARARRQSMILGGLASFGSDKRGLGRLADAAMAGQQFGSQFRQQAAAAMAQADRERRQQQIGELIGEGEDVSRGDVNKAIAMAEASGMSDAANRLIEFKDTLPGPEEQEFQDTELPDGTKAIFDKTNGRYLTPSGEVMMELPGPPEERVEDDLQHVTGQDPATGEPVMGVLNKTKGTFTPVRGIQPLTDADEQKVDPEAIQTAEQATLMRTALDNMKDFLINDDGSVNEPPSFIDMERFEQDGILVAAGARDIDTETQSFLQAQEQILLELAHRIAGVRGISAENARAAIRRAFGFQQGDSPENIRQTLQQIETRTRSLEMQAGGALNLFSDVPTPGEDERDLLEGI